MEAVRNPARTIADLDKLLATTSETTSSAGFHGWQERDSGVATEDDSQASFGLISPSGSADPPCKLRTRPSLFLATPPKGRVDTLTRVVTESRRRYKEVAQALAKRVEDAGEGTVKVSIRTLCTDVSVVDGHAECPLRHVLLSYAYSEKINCPELFGFSLADPDKGRIHDWLDLDMPIGEHEALSDSPCIWFRLRYWKVPDIVALEGALLHIFFEETQLAITRAYWDTPDQHLIQLAGILMHFRTSQATNGSGPRKSRKAGRHLSDAARVASIQSFNSPSEVTKFFPESRASGTAPFFWMGQTEQALEQVAGMDERCSELAYVELAQRTPMFGSTSFLANRDSGEEVVLCAFDFGLGILHNSDSSEPATTPSGHSPKNLSTYTFSQLLTWRVAATGVRLKFSGQTDDGKPARFLVTFQMANKDAGEFCHLLDTYSKMSLAKGTERVPDSRLWRLEESHGCRLKETSSKAPAGSSVAQWLAIYHSLRHESGAVGETYEPFLRAAHACLFRNSLFSEFVLPAPAKGENEPASKPPSETEADVISPEQFRVIARALQLVQDAEREVNDEKDLILNTPRRSSSTKGINISKIVVAHHPIGGEIGSLVSIVSASPRLRVLDLNNTQLSSRLFTSLLKIPMFDQNLTILDISNNNIGNKVFSNLIVAFGNFATLSVLRASGNKLSDKACDSLALALKNSEERSHSEGRGQVCRIYELDLSYNRLTDSSLERLLAFSLPEEIPGSPQKKKSMRNTLTDSKRRLRSLRFGKDSLSPMKTRDSDDRDAGNIDLGCVAESLDLSGNSGLGVKGCTVLGWFFRRHPGALAKLGLANTQIGANGVMTLFQALQESDNTHLNSVELDLTKVSVGGRKGWDQILSQLPRAEKLAGLELRDADISPTGMGNIFKAVEKTLCHTLAKLDLTGILCQPRDIQATVESMVNALKATTALRHLSLARTQLFSLKGEKLFLNFCAGLRWNNSLRFLDLCDTGIDAAKCEGLSNSIPHLMSLKELVLDQNVSLGNEGLACICDKLSQSPALSHLSFQSCSLTEKAYPVVRELMRSGSQPLRCVDFRDNSPELASLIDNALAGAATIVDIRC